MSLMSYLNTNAGATRSTDPQIAKALATVADGKAAQKSGAVAAAPKSPASSIQITIQARRAANEKADAGKSAASLSAALRASLNADYAAAGQKNSADLTAQSGRALATIALNESGQFSRSEIAAAKTELRARDRQSILTEVASGPLTATSLAAYTKQALGARASMSAEERSLRDGNPNIR